MSVWMVIAGFSILLLSGIVTLVFGVRGRRIDDHPICRKCGYDLVGSPEIPDLCPECACDLTVRNAIRTGRRSRLPVVILVGLLLITLTVTMASFVGWREFHDYDFNRIKPFWMLINDAEAPGKVGQDVRGELFIRLVNRRLSESQVNRLVERALRIQRDPNAVWSRTTTTGLPTDWSDLIERAWVDGYVSILDWREYVRTAYDVPFRIVARSHIRAGQPLPIEVRGGSPRCSRVGENHPNINSGFFWAVAEIQSISCNGDLINFAPPILHGDRNGIFNVSRKLPLSLPPGRYELEIPCEFAVSWFPQRRTGPSYVPAVPSDSEVVRWSRTIHVPFDVVDESTPIVKKVSNDSLRHDIIRSVGIHLGETRIWTDSDMFWGRNGIVAVDPLSVALSFDVFCRVDEHEVRIGSFASSTNRSRTLNVGDEAIGNDPGSLFPNANVVTIIFRTNPLPAEETIDITEIWDGEIVFEDVPLRTESSDLD